jgi:hypothetical protein
MATHTPDERSSSQTPPSRRKTRTRRPDVTEARSSARRAKLDAQASARASRTPQAENGQQSAQAKRRAAPTLARAIEEYLQDHEGGNSSAKTLEWHRTALRLFHLFLKEERAITLVAEVDSADISAWFAHMRKATGKHGRQTEDLLQFTHELLERLRPLLRIPWIAHLLARFAHIVGPLLGAEG